MSEEDSRAIRHSEYPTTTIEITEEQFDKLRDDRGNWMLMYVDYVDVGETSYSVRWDDFGGTAYFKEVENAV